MSLTDAMLRFLVECTDEQHEDYQMRWDALQQQTPAQTLERPEWLDAWMSPMVITPEIVEILGEAATWCADYDGLSVYRAA